MKRLFLTSQVQYVAASIAKKLGDDTHQFGVFITTPLLGRTHTEAELAWHYENRRQLNLAGFVFDDYDLTGKSSAELAQDLDKYGVMYVEGGNPFHLLKQSQQNNFGNYVKNRVDNGLVYIGTSTGSIIAGPDISFAERPGHTAAESGLTNTDGFGLVNFATVPHWGDPAKKEKYTTLTIPRMYSNPFPFILLSDNQYVEVRDDWYRIIDITKE